jgi:hypothetical protein
MKNALLYLLLAVVLCGCQEPTPVDPSLTNPLTMSLRVDYTTTPISLRLYGSVFKNTSGPVETPFDTATVYISEDRFGTYQTLATTTQTRLPLTMLAPGKVYYLTTKGRVGNFTSAVSAPILFVPEVIRPARSLITFNIESQYWIAPAGSSYVRWYPDAQTGQFLTQLVDAAGNSRVLTYANTEKGIFYCKGWQADGQRVFFQISRGGKLALITYNIDNQIFADVTLPAEIELGQYAIAPDGQQIVFRDTKRDGLWVFDGRTNTQKRFDVTRPLHDLVWATDSRTILMTHPATDRTENQVVVQLDPLSGKQTTILSGTTRVSRATLSPDGRFLLFTGTYSSGGSLWVQNQQTLALRPVGSAGSQFGWLNDGTFWATDLSGVSKFIP